jgi:hypothetical protein
VIVKDLRESLKTVRDVTEKDIELTRVLKEELDTAKTENETLL